MNKIIFRRRLAFRVAQKGVKGDQGVGLPAGGTTGQILKKNSNTDYDFAWEDETGGGASGLSDLSDVTLTALADDELLFSSGGVFINRTLAEAGISAVGHTHTASDISDFDTAVSANSDVAANTAARHTHSNQAILDNVTAAFTTADETKLDYITITQAVDLDAIESRVNALDAAVVLQGGWDASSGSFPGGGSAQAGDSYIVTVGGTVDSVDFSANDRIVAVTDNASTTTYTSNWLKLDYTDQVLSVAGKTGAVTLAASDIVSGTFADARISESSVTQHEAALAITESQISDLGAYLENVSEDTSPTLGGDLDANSNSITNLTNLNGVAVSNYALATGDVYTGTHDFGGADDFEIPNGASITLDTAGQIGIDTTVTDFSAGVLEYYSGEVMGVVAMPIAQFTSPTDGYVVAYNATNDEFELVAQSGGGGTPAGSDTHVQFNDGGSSFGGEASFAYNKTNDTLTLDGGADANRIVLQAHSTQTNAILDVEDSTGTSIAQIEGDGSMWATDNSNGVAFSVEGAAGDTGIGLATAGEMGLYASGNEVARADGSVPAFSMGPNPITFGSSLGVNSYAIERTGTEGISYRPSSGSVGSSDINLYIFNGNQTTASSNQERLDIGYDLGNTQWVFQNTVAGIGTARGLSMTFAGATLNAANTTDNVFTVNGLTSHSGNLFQAQVNSSDVSYIDAEGAIFASRQSSSPFLNFGIVEDPDSGIGYAGASGQWRGMSNGSEVWRTLGGQFALGTSRLNFGESGSASRSSIARDGANYKLYYAPISGSVAGVATEQRMYNGGQNNSSSNHERLTKGYDTANNEWYLKAEAAGTGLVRDINIADLIKLTGSSEIGFFGETPASQATGYTTFTNLSSDRTLDADSTTLDEVADVLGTLIEDLKSYGLLAA